jgi:hypothetical protein
MTKELLAVLDMTEDEQEIWVKTNVCKTNNERCTYSLADLAFRLHQGKIAGKKPIEYIIEALIKLDNDKE